MASKVNKHGLAREIPSDVKRSVRQRCGFGCVFCGKALVHYDHFAPEFADAVKHDPAGITLLCAGHHDEKRAGLSNVDVALANDDPFCRRDGFSWSELRFRQPLTVSIGQIRARECRDIIRVYGFSLLRIEAPGGDGGPAMVSARFNDPDSGQLARIVKNEVRNRAAGSWDIETVGRTTTYRSAHRALSLQMEKVSDQELRISRLRMSFMDYEFDHSDAGHSVVRRAGVPQQAFSDLAFDGCEAAISAELSGVSYGVGGGSVFIGAMRG